MSAVAAVAKRATARAGVRRERHQVAYPLLVGVIALVAIGVVMVYSASSVRSYISTADPSSQGFQQASGNQNGVSFLFCTRSLALPRTDCTLTRIFCSRSDVSWRCWRTILPLDFSTWLANASIRRLIRYWFMSASR